MLEKIITRDSINVVGNFKILQIREEVRIVDDGNTISSSYHRYTLAPGDSLENEDDEVRNIANLVWTDEVITSYQQSLLT